MSLYGESAVIVAAPTGKAAVRLTEALAEAGLSIKAMTWHYLLYQDRLSDADFVIGDETSMHYPQLLAQCLKTMKPSAHLLLVGDEYQLPSVSPGALLRDLIDAGLPNGHLRHIQRNSGNIVAVCSALRDGLPWTPGGNLEIRHVSTVGSAQDVADRLSEVAKQTVLQIIASGVSVNDIQVLSSTNDTRKAANLVLQKSLNRNPLLPEMPFKLHDKIICLENSYYTHVGPINPDAIARKNRVWVANGEIGTIVYSKGKTLIVDVDTPQRRIIVPVGKKTDEDDSGCNFVLAYAITTHKSQGSEWALRDRHARWQQ